MSSFRRDIRFLLSRRDFFRFAILLAILVAGSLLELLALSAVPLFISLLLTQGEIPDGIAGKALEYIFSFLSITTPTQRLLVAGGGLLALNFLRTAWDILGMALQYRILFNRRIELSGRLLHDYLMAPAEFLSGRNTTELLNLAVVECDNVIQGIYAPLLEFFRYVALAICVTALLLCWMPAMTLVAIALLGGSGLLVLGVRNRRLHRFAQEEQRGRETSMKLGGEALGSRVEAAVFGRRGFFEGRFRNAMRILATAQGKNMLQTRSVWPFLEFLSLASLLVVTLGAMMVSHGNLQEVAPKIALLAIALVRLKTIFINLMQNIIVFKRFRPSLTLVCDDLRTLEAQLSAHSGEEDAVLPLAFHKSIIVQNVTFTYPQTDRPALSDLTLEITKGEAIGIVGATGCGKSTLLKLLLGFLKPQEGKIMVDGNTLDDDNLPAWRHAIGYVPQKPFLMDGTVAENVTFGRTRTEQNAAALQNALKLSQLEKVVEELPNGMDTPLGEYGQRFSGGQCQRVAIARALYRNADILVLDEATSALDQGTDAAFSEALEAVRKSGVTTITVTHRMENIRSCDRIFFLKDGRLEAEGTYDDLLKRSAEFRKFAKA